MKQNLNMDKKLNLNPTQEPEEKRKLEKAKRNAAFENNIEPEG